MSNKKRLQKAGDYIHKTFFPLWDQKGQWAIKEDYKLLGQGLCSEDKKTIFLQFVSSKNDDLYLLLIHEICHAVTNSSHGKKWFDRMLKASNRAKEIGLKNLSERLLNELVGYKEAPPINAKYVYGTIEDWVIQSETLVPYKPLIEALSKDLGCTKGDLTKKYTLTKRAYQKAVKLRKQNEQAEKAFRMRFKKEIEAQTG